MELRSAACRGAWHGTDESKTAHGPHSFFWDQWAGPSDCPGWTKAESDAESLVRRLLDAGLSRPGLELRCHPAVEYAMLAVIIPSYAEFCDPAASLTIPLQRIGGIPVIRTVAAERGAWELASDKGVIASGCVRSA